MNKRIRDVYLCVIIYIYRRQSAKLSSYSWK